VITAAAEQRCVCGDTLPPQPALPGLAPAVDDFFAQVDAR
jgi:hypothetical protein